MVQISRHYAVRCLSLAELIGGDDFRKFAAAAEVEPVDAGAQVVASGLHAVPGEHANASFARGLAEAAQGLDLAVLAWKEVINLIRFRVHISL